MPKTSRDSCDTLFCRIAGFTRMQEDLLTECFAATLQSDSTAASEYWRLMTRHAPKLKRARGAIHVTTQHTVGRSARIDMRVVRQGHALGVEHKLYAPEGARQLPRYLGLPKTDARFIAFVSADFRTVGQDVLDSGRYVQPSSRQSHFLWADLYPVVARSAARGSPFAAATVALMNKLDLAPVHPIIGDVRDPQKDIHLRKLWIPLQRSLGKSGYDYVKSSIGHNRKSEMWIEDGPSAHLDVVRLDPFSSPTSLVVRLKADSRTKRDYMLKRLLKSRAGIPCGHTLGILPHRLPQSSNGFDWAIDVKVGWTVLLKRCNRTNTSLIESTLKRFVLRLMSSAARDAV
jgi:hypothetical protein